MNHQNENTKKENNLQRLIHQGERLKRGLPISDLTDEKDAEISWLKSKVKKL